MKKLIWSGVFLFLLSFVALFLVYQKNNRSAGLLGESSVNSANQKPGIAKMQKPEIKKFTSEADFQSYLKKAKQLSSSRYFSGLNGGSNDLKKESLAQTALPEASWDSSQEKASFTPDHSTTNVQVFGIDEPDVLKTNGQEIFYSQKELFRPVFEEEVPVSTDIINVRVPSSTNEILPPPQQTGTSLVKAFPFAELKKDGSIPYNGELLLSGKNLLVFSNQGQTVLGYDVSNPETAKESWRFDLDGNTNLVTARLLGEKVYLITQTSLNQNQPCPMEPLLKKGERVQINCSDIYHSGEIMPAEVVYNLFLINPASGQVEKTTSFLGSANSTVFVSSSAIYLAYQEQPSQFSFLAAFIKANPDLFSKETLAKINQLEGYDLSIMTKMIEIQNILSQEENFSNRSSEEEGKIEQRMKSYTKDHLRDYEKTNLVKFGINNLELLATGYIPGQLLNQFSLDEYQNNLRVAVTLNGFEGGSEQSENDVYVLDPKLSIVGSLVGMGLTEKIYSARFVGNRGFLVTFRQTDPFYVLDLADPKNPKKTGELKIPGYSSYLHPLGENLVLGIGQEGSQLKISLFDVSNPTLPVEKQKYLLEENWSEILNNHHAFSMDYERNNFFLPTSKGGYVFSITQEGIVPQKTIEEPGIKRGVFIEGHLYLAGGNKIIVLGNQNFDKIAELPL